MLSVVGLVSLEGLHYSAPTAAVVLSVLACTSTVGWRRRWPSVAVVVVLSAALVYQRLTGDTQGVAVSVAVVLSFYSAARTELQVGRRRRVGALAGYALVVVVGINAGSSGFSPVGVVLSWVPLVVLPLAAGWLVEHHRDLNARLAETRLRLEAEQAGRAEQVRGSERNRVARELHDVVAHSVSVMVIQAGAARLLAADDLAGAAEAVGLVGWTGREALGDLRRVMGVLRRDDVLDGSARPRLDQIARLIEPVRAAGMDVELHVEGAPVPLAAEVDLTAYRVAQEALTNAVKHAGRGRVTVRVGYQPGLVELDVTNTAQTTDVRPRRLIGSGQGLIGMRERVMQCGGQLEVGPRPQGGWRVHAHLPASADRPVAKPTLEPTPELERSSPSWLARWSDPVLAAASFVVLEPAAVSYSHRHGWLALNTALVALISLACLWRRRLPLGFLVAVGGLGLAVHGLAPVDRATVTGTYVALVPTYSVAAWASGGQAVAGLVIWLAGAFAAAAIGHELSAGLAGGSLMAVLAWSAGRLVRQERDLTRRLTDSTAQLVAEREQRARLVVAEERARLARELQNQVAQLVAAMVVQAEAAANLLGGDPSAASAAISSIESTGREALGQMREILGVLRASAPPRQLAPQPGLSLLPALINGYRDRGHTVELAIGGAPAPLAGAVDLTAYRIIEEALQRSANPSARLRIALRYTDNNLQVDLDGCQTAGEWPSQAVRERIRVCGGDLRYASNGSGSSHLVIYLPRQPERVAP